MKPVLIALGLILMSLPSLGQEVEPIAVLSLTEGPTVDRAGNVYFTDTLGSRIMMLDTTGVLSIYRDPSNVAIGLVIDDQNRLVAAEGGYTDRGGNKIEGTPRLTRTDLSSGEVEILADSYMGAPLGRLNDITHDSRGRLYATSPAGVYRVDGPGRIAKLFDETANGIQVSPTDSRLYVSRGPGTIVVYDLDTEGNASNGRVHYEFDGLNADGMSIDIEGNLYAVAKPPSPEPAGTFGATTGVYVISPDGDLLRFIPVRDPVRNITFAGPDMKTLYVTAGSSLYKLSSEVAGLSR